MLRKIATELKALCDERGKELASLLSAIENRGLLLDIDDENNISLVTMAEPKAEAQKQNKSKKSDRPSCETAIQIVKSEGLWSRDKWRSYCKAHPELNLPQKANEYYGISWDEFFGRAKKSEQIESKEAETEAEVMVGE